MLALAVIVFAALLECCLFLRVRAARRRELAQRAAMVRRILEAA